MMPFIKWSEYLLENTTGKNMLGSGEEKEGEREREQWINRVREGALVRNGNGVRWKWPLV